MVAVLQLLRQRARREHTRRTCIAFRKESLPFRSGVVRKGGLPHRRANFRPGEAKDTALAEDTRKILRDTFLPGANGNSRTWGRGARLLLKPAAAHKQEKERRTSPSRADKKSGVVKKEGGPSFKPAAVKVQAAVKCILRPGAKGETCIGAEERGRPFKPDAIPTQAKVDPISALGGDRKASVLEEGRRPPIKPAAADVEGEVGLTLLLEADGDACVEKAKEGPPAAADVQAEVGATSPPGTQTHPIATEMSTR